MKFEELKKWMSESKMVLTEENVLDIYVYLTSGGTVEDYPNKDKLQIVKDRFKKLI